MDQRSCVTAPLVRLRLPFMTAPQPRATAVPFCAFPRKGLFDRVTVISIPPFARLLFFFFFPPVP
jgi:hypothetical protein